MRAGLGEHQPVLEPRKGAGHLALYPLRSLPWASVLSSLPSRIPRWLGNLSFLLLTEKPHQEVHEGCKLSPVLPEGTLSGSVVSSVLVFFSRPCNICMEEPFAFPKYSVSSQHVLVSLFSVPVRFDCLADSLHIIFKLAGAASQTALQDQFFQFKGRHEDALNCCK